jgi:TolA-binding protein
MKLQQILGSLLVAMMLSSCVTTRAQLNEKRGQSMTNADDEASAPAVQSESLGGETVPAPQPATEPGASPAVVQAQPTSQYGMEEMRAELSRLSGKVEEMEHEKKSQQATQAEEQQKLLSRIAELEKQLQEKEAAAKGPSVPEGKTALQAAKESFTNSKYENAISFLDGFIESNPKPKELEDATFMRAESYFRLKEFKKAIIDYSKFPEKFQKSNYHPKALLKLAESFEALDMKEDAKFFYQDLFDKFPKTLEGKVAKKKIDGKSSKK